MKLTSKFLALFALLAMVFIVAAAAVQHKAMETAKDPVCGMDVKKSEAKATFDYKGTTYYFCAVGCKDKFAQDPEKYLQKKVEKIEKVVKVVKEEKAGCTCPKCQGKTHEMASKCPHCGKDMAKPDMAKGQGCPMMQGKTAMATGPHSETMSMASCPMAGMMHGQDIEFKVENTKDGIQVSLSSKNAEVVKKLQDMAAKMKAGCESKDCGGDCFDK